MKCTGSDGAPLEEPTDEALVRQCQCDQQAAFAELVDRYKYRVSWMVRRMVGPEDEEDLTQEVFLRVHRALPNFRTDGTFKTWIYKIARNLCLSELRKRGRRGQHVDLDDVGEERIHGLLPESDSGLESKIESQDVSRMVRTLIGRLPGHYGTVLTLFYLNQLRYEEIAEVLEVPLGTVKTHLHRARLRLRDLVLAESSLVGLLEESCTNAVTEGG